MTDVKIIVFPVVGSTNAEEFNCWWYRSAVIPRVGEWLYYRGKEVAVVRVVHYLDNQPDRLVRNQLDDVHVYVK